MQRYSYFFKVLLLFLIISCDIVKEKKNFEKLPSAITGITAENTIETNLDFNIINYLYFYNGGGVALGDINNDGLVDIFLTLNQKKNKLYLNKGGMYFEDITQMAQVGGEAEWSTGVTMVDINHDGLLDIYVCNLSNYLNLRGKNELYINNGDLTFSEQALSYGLAHEGFSTQAAFFDYDLDGDLDCYLACHSVHTQRTFGSTSLRENTDNYAGDKLYKNEDGFFIDVTSEAHVYSSQIGYGLAVGISDINFDGYPDIYVSNDFHENDYLYINQKDGTFSEQSSHYIQHSSRFSMGNDIADINNDGKSDILVLDMLPQKENIVKTSLGDDNFNVYIQKIKLGYQHQFMQNTLQLNRGLGLPFSEIAYYSHISATDWSWAPLIADFDNDGKKDIFITNGIVKRPNDMDYINYRVNTTTEENRINIEQEYFEKLIEKMPTVKLSNYLFHQGDEVRFKNVAEEWGLAEPSYSNGAAYADLDNDGDVDMVVNNINQEVFVYKNLIKEKKQEKSHFLQIHLKGNKKNTFGIGAKILAKQGGKIFYKEQFLTRGFQSSISPVLHIGLGALTHIDSLWVIWQDKKMQLLDIKKVDTTLVFYQEDAKEVFSYPTFDDDQIPWSSSVKNYFDYQHRENSFIDFNRETLIPKKLSNEGPHIAVADINGDGLDDVFLGGAKHQAGKLFIQTPSGKFQISQQELFAQDSVWEDIDVLFLDIDKDEDKDLYICSGGNEFFRGSNYLKDRLYINDNGVFRKDSVKLPNIYENSSCIVPADFDKDGDIDIFLGVRNITSHYGGDASSYLLINDGKGNLIDNTEKWAPFLKNIGMVSSALWMDMNNDDRLDLIVCGEWMPIRCFIQEKEKFKEITDTIGFDITNGWWNILYATDFDRDGDMDIFAGNWGLNQKLQPSLNHPIQLYVNDFDGNSKQEGIITYFKDNKNLPFPLLDEVTQQIPSLKKKFPVYNMYANKSIEEIFDDEKIKNSQVKKVYMFESVYIENKGNLKFKIHPLPFQAQFFPIFSIYATDMDADGYKEVILAGNFFHLNPNLGRGDAGNGLIISYKDSLSYPLQVKKDGLGLSGQIRDIAVVNINNTKHIVFTKNNDRLQIFKCF